jgi:hypothetical protein
MRGRGGRCLCRESTGRHRRAGERVSEKEKRECRIYKGGEKKRERERKTHLTHQKVGSSLEQVVGVKDPLIVGAQMRAYGLSWSKAHLQGYLRPASLSANRIKSPLIVHQLGKEHPN